MKNKIICIIDDDPVYQIIIRKVIEKAAILSKVISFQNGNEALISLENRLVSNMEIPDIILLDIEMPLLDGWGFMEQLRPIRAQYTKAIAIYIVSSSIAPEDKEKAKSYCEVLGYLSKPLSSEALLTIINDSIK